MSAKTVFLTQFELTCDSGEDKVCCKAFHVLNICTMLAVNVSSQSRPLTFGKYLILCSIYYCAFMHS